VKALPCLGKVEKGKFIPEDVKSFKSAFYSHEGKRVRVTVERFRNRRSDPQNRYYWGIVVPMVGEAIGESDAEAVHDMLKVELNYEILVVGDKEIRVPKSTAKLDTMEFKQYVERVQRWGSEFLSLYIPGPDEI
jgi:hypothetical protein